MKTGKLSVVCALSAVIVAAALVSKSSAAQSMQPSTEADAVVGGEWFAECTTISCVTLSNEAFCPTTTIDYPNCNMTFTCVTTCDTIMPTRYKCTFELLDTCDVGALLNCGPTGTKGSCPASPRHTGPGVNDGVCERPLCSDTGGEKDCEKAPVICD